MTKKTLEQELEEFNDAWWNFVEVLIESLKPVLEWANKVLGIIEEGLDD